MMRPGLAVGLISLCLSLPVRADEPKAVPVAKSCPKVDERITDSRIGDRPLPLLSGDPTHGFKAACSVSWTRLSPNHAPVPVQECYQGNLLKLGATGLCGPGSDPLWVSSRWVRTNADPLADAKPRAACQQLQTGSYAATRDYTFDCQPVKRDLPSTTAPPVPAKPADASQPAGNPGH
jgi:hypothetical protein